MKEKYFKTIFRPIEDRLNYKDYFIISKITGNISEVKSNIRYCNIDDYDIIFVSEKIKNKLDINGKSVRWKAVYPNNRPGNWFNLGSLWLLPTNIIEAESSEEAVLYFTLNK